MTVPEARPAATTVRRLRGRRIRALVTAVVITTAVGAGIVAPAATAADAVGLISDSAVPGEIATNDTRRVEVGTKFSPTTSGTLTGVQFYQSAPASGVTSASVWSSTGALLRRVTVNPSGQVGWRTVPVNVALQAGQTYTVSIFDANGRVGATEGFFSSAKTTNGITTPANAGVHRYANASTFPSLSGWGYSFLVDVVFTSADVAPNPTPRPSHPTPTPTPTPTHTPETPAPPPAAEPDGPVDTDAVYGPDGTHWPSSTPRADEARVVDVAPSWSAISSAITANARSSDPVVICVAPGTISGGNGATSTARGVLQNVGDPNRATRILVSACDGIGTVEVAAGSGVAFVGVGGVSIVGIDFSAQPVMIRNSEVFALGYSEVPRLLVTANGGDGVRDVEVVEVVAGADSVSAASGDRAEVKSAGGYDVDGLRFVGFYAAPHYKPNGSRDHVDTLQFVTTSGDGAIGDVVIEDSVLFQSSDQGIMSGGNVGGSITGSALLGGTTSQLRYPVYAGGDPITLSNVLHGTWSNLAAVDSIVAGSISSAFSFDEVAESESTQGTRGFAPLGALTLADLDRLAPVPDDARLAQIWHD